MELADRENNKGDTGKGTFAFLRLPVEVREMIYHNHLTSEPILPRYPFFNKRWTPIDLLYVNRTIYNEAFFHLYTRGEFVLAVRPESIFGLATCLGMTDVSASNGLELFVKSKKILHLLRNIALDIHWPSIEYSELMDCDRNQDTPTTNEMLKQNMATVGAMLSRLPGLRIIDVSWLHMTVYRSEVIATAPSKYRIPVWLRGLKQVRRKNEQVLIRMPSKSPISTEQLSKDQALGEDLNTLREIGEDLAEMEENLRDLYR